jgi:hypothetical protein
LGKALADSGDYTEAFRYFLEGNRLKRATFAFKIARSAKTFRQIQERFSHRFFASRKDFGCPDKTPIFILGMPRSGSTLIEQIVASHPDVYGAGELLFVREVMLANMPANHISMIAQSALCLDSDRAAEIGSRYIERVREIEPDSRFITDKMPENFLLIGIIRLLLPNAKIIHSVRSPEDTCLSIFRAKFTGEHNYAYDLTELGQYYRLYSEMMSHWHGLFPGYIYDMHYEKLIENQEEESRKLLEFCGLPWSEQCLDFHNSSRTVQTSSSAQVRRPMYQSSVAGWKRYEQQLQSLLAVLK